MLPTTESNRQDDAMKVEETYDINDAWVVILYIYFYYWPIISKIFSIFVLVISFYLITIVGIISSLRGSDFSSINYCARERERSKGMERVGFLSLPFQSLKTFLVNSCRSPFHNFPVHFSNSAKYATLCSCVWWSVLSFLREVLGYQKACGRSCTHSPLSILHSHAWPLATR